MICICFQLHHPCPDAPLIPTQEVLHLPVWRWCIVLACLPAVWTLPSLIMFILIILLESSLFSASSGGRLVYYLVGIRVRDVTLNCDLSLICCLTHMPHAERNGVAFPRPVIGAADPFHNRQWNGRAIQSGANSNLGSYCFHHAIVVARCLSPTSCQKAENVLVAVGECTPPYSFPLDSPPPPANLFPSGRAHSPRFQSAFASSSLETSSKLFSPALLAADSTPSRTLIECR